MPTSRKLSTRLLTTLLVIGLAQAQLRCFVENLILSSGETSPSFATSAIGVFTVGDIDGDGDADVVASVSVAGVTFELVWIENDGVWPPIHVHVLPHEFNGDLQEILLADMDSDGHVDIITAWSRTVTVFRNDGSQGFTEAYVDIREEVQGIGIIDGIDQNERPGLIRVDQAAIWWYRASDATAPLGYSATQISNVSGEFEYFNRPSIADLGNDGYPDIVAFQYDISLGIINFSWFEYAPYLNGNAGGFRERRFGQTTKSRARNTAVGDIDGMGIWISFSISYYSRTSMSLDW